MPVKMPHSNFKERSQEFNTGVGKFPVAKHSSTHQKQI